MKRKETKINLISASESEVRDLISFLVKRKAFDGKSPEVRLRSIPNLSVKAEERNKILKQFGVEDDLIRRFKKEMKVLSGKTVKIENMNDPRWVVISYNEVLFPISIKDIDMRFSIKV